MMDCPTKPGLTPSSVNEGVPLSSFQDEPTLAFGIIYGLWCPKGQRLLSERLLTLLLKSHLLTVLKLLFGTRYFISTNGCTHHPHLDQHYHITVKNTIIIILLVVVVALIVITRYTNR